MRPILILLLAVLLVPLAGAAQTNDATLVPAPAALRALDDLLMMGMSPLVTACNTYPLTASETWMGRGAAGVFAYAEHDGDPVSPETLERALLDAQGEGWAQTFRAAQRCESEGGFCACASISLLTGRSLWCTACCQAGMAPSCACGGLYVVPSCGCQGVSP